MGRAVVATKWIASTHVLVGSIDKSLRNNEDEREREQAGGLIVTMAIVFVSSNWHCIELVLSIYGMFCSSALKFMCYLLAQTSS